MKLKKVVLRRQFGLTLVELMISMALALLVVLLATTFFLSSRNVYTAQDESAKIDETGRFVSQTLTRLIQQTGFIPRYNGDVTTVSYDHLRAPASQFALLFGTNNGATDWQGSSVATINNSDSLTIRFWGSGGASGNPDGSIADCLGQEIPPPLGGINGADGDRAEMTLYVGTATTDNEPALYCRTKNTTSGNAIQPMPVARGVERLHFLYGVDTSAAIPRDNMADVYMTANQVTANGVWNRVVAVRYAFVVRSALNARADPDVDTYRLFGPGYALTDPGSTFTVPSGAEQTRLRKVFTGIVHVRNGVEGNNL